MRDHTLAVFARRLLDKADRHSKRNEFAQAAVLQDIVDSLIEADKETERVEREILLKELKIPK